MLEVIYWAALVAGTYGAFVYFRDLGDITQVVMDVSRANMLQAIRNENKLIALGLAGTAIAVAAHYAGGAGPGWLTVTMVIVNGFMVGFPWVWLHVGLRNQQNSATYYSIEEAKAYLRPDESVIVIENKAWQFVFIYKIIIIKR